MATVRSSTVGYGWKIVKKDKMKLMDPHEIIRHAPDLLKGGAAVAGAVKVTDVQRRRRQMRLRNAACLILFAILASCDKRPSGYDLPILLGSSPRDVQSILGSPDSIVKPPKDPALAGVTVDDDVKIHWYYSSGVVGSFNDDRLSEITLFTFCDYKGFLVYTGSIVHGVTLADSKSQVLQKLGKPVKIENDPIRDGDGSKPNVPVVWPSEGRYYWHFPEYTICASFLNQAQQVSDGVVWPKDGLVSIVVKR